MVESLFRYGGWSAYFTGTTSVIGLVLLFTFFAIGGPFGFLNDIIAIISLVPYPIIVLSLHRLSPSSAKNLSSASGAMGIGGALGVIMLQVLLVTNAMSFGQQLPLVLAVGGGIGIWFILSNRLAIARLGNGVTRIGSAGGALILSGSMIFWIGFLAGGASLDFADPAAFASNPMATLGFILVLGAYLVFPIWFLILGRKLMSLRTRS